MCLLSPSTHSARLARASERQTGGRATGAINIPAVIDGRRSGRNAASITGTKGQACMRTRGREVARKGNGKERGMGKGEDEREWEKGREWEWGMIKEEWEGKRGKGNGKGRWKGEERLWEGNGEGRAGTSITSDNNNRETRRPQSGSGSSANAL